MLIYGRKSKIILISSLLFLNACGGSENNNGLGNTEIVQVSDPVLPEIVYDASFEASDWTEQTHTKNVDPNFGEVFDDNQVKRLDFVIKPINWESMLYDMTSIFGEFGQPSGNNGLADTNENPIFVPAEVFYNNKQWYRVGIRFKGNSSLQTSWRQGILKLSFKLDFDEFEDEYPQIKNQRFYGFKKFSLKNNYEDTSFVREKVAADVFSRAGLAVSHTAFYSLYVNYGDGPKYFGLYTLVEEVDGTVLDTQFSSDEGNLYKPENDGATFALGSFNEENFEKKTNEDEADWSDIQALFTALHDSTATSAPQTWRTNLEAVFDVDVFLKYLAVNGIIQNWDTYGVTAHNYYLYNNPETSKLTWIPWDNNEALQIGKLGGALHLDFSNLASAKWPLIAKIYADDEYRARYNQYLLSVAQGAFEQNRIQGLYEDYEALISPYATTELSGYTFLRSSDDFYRAIDELIKHAENRIEAVYEYLDGQ